MRLGNQLIVAVAENIGKQPLFSVDERTEIVVNAKCTQII